MKVSSIQRTPNYTQKANKQTNFKGYINDKLIDDIITNTPEQMKNSFHEGKITVSRYSNLMRIFENATLAITENLKKLHPKTRLETFNNGLGKHTAYLINDSSNLIHPLNFVFCKDNDESSNIFHLDIGLNIINSSPETNIEILSDLAKCLDNLDKLGVEAQMALYTKEPSFRDEIIKKWEDRYWRNEKSNNSQKHI